MIFKRNRSIRLLALCQRVGWEDWRHVCRSKIRGANPIEVFPTNHRALLFIVHRISGNYPCVLLSACATIDTQASSSGASGPSVNTCLAVPCCITRLRWGAMAWTSESFSSSHPRLSSSLPGKESSDPAVTMTNGVLESNILGMAISLSCLSGCIYERVDKTHISAATYRNISICGSHGWEEWTSGGKKSHEA